MQLLDYHTIKVWLFMSGIYSAYVALVPASLRFVGTFVLDRLRTGVERLFFRIQIQKKKADDLRLKLQKYVVMRYSCTPKYFVGSRPPTQDKRHFTGLAIAHQL